MIMKLWSKCLNEWFEPSPLRGLSEIIKWSQEGLSRLDSNNGKFTSVTYNESDKDFEEPSLTEMISNFLAHSNKIELVEDGEVLAHLFKTLFEEFSKIEPVLNVSIGRTMRNLGYKTIVKDSMRLYKGIRVK